MQDKSTLLIRPHPDLSVVRPGAIVTFVCGPGEFPDPRFAVRRGKAYGMRRGRFGDSLRVKLPCGKFDYVPSLTTIGIGAYLWDDRTGRPADPHAIPAHLRRSPS